MERGAPDDSSSRESVARAEVRDHFARGLARIAGAHRNAVHAHRRSARAIHAAQGRSREGIQALDLEHRRGARIVQVNDLDTVAAQGGARLPKRRTCRPRRQAPTGARQGCSAGVCQRALDARERRGHVQHRRRHAALLRGCPHLRRLDQLLPRRVQVVGDADARGVPPSSDTQVCEAAESQGKRGKSGVRVVKRAAYPSNGPSRSTA